jgi:phosphate uptake regulator
MSLWLAEHIVKNKFTGAIIFGSLREGKTSYAMKVAFRIYKLENPEWTDEQCWNEVFKNMFFNLEDMIKYLETKLISKDDTLLPVITQL